MRVMIKVKVRIRIRFSVRCDLVRIEKAPASRAHFYLPKALSLKCSLLLISTCQIYLVVVWLGVVGGGD